MTRDEINELTPDALVALLAERVMGWASIPWGIGAGWKLPSGDVICESEWHPEVYRDDLARLVAAVPSNRQLVFHNTIGFVLWNPESTVPFAVWLLTCDPLIICRAVALAVCGSEA